MIAGFASLAFNPAAWIVVAVVAFSGFSAGVVKGWNASNSDHWRQQVEALTDAAQQKERLLRADAARAEIDRFELVREKAELEKVIEETRNPGACRLSVSELAGLQQLAAGRGGNLPHVPSTRP
jgi:hypothetical protein